MSSALPRFTASVRAREDTSSLVLEESSDSLDLCIRKKKDRKKARSLRENRVIDEFIDEVSVKCSRQEKQQVCSILQEWMHFNWEFLIVSLCQHYRECWECCIKHVMADPKFLRMQLLS